MTRMRMSIVAWMASSVVLTSGALLAVFAQNFNDRPRDRRTVTFSIDPRFG
jgi:hypothetical protein